ncbi:acid-sensing ion channel 3-like [Lethenteron reissneri]|uniref:acid-sensing ion channel 3-like n=1 Tax=Lethenteron reissneri TaxID=7753 RepID=UPI002AB7670E|nr:acid-sensing ion channel 3-like [Lethenteron reissneri]
MPISIICSMPLPFEERAAESPAKGRDLERERRRRRQRQQQRRGDGRFEREMDSPPAPSAPPAATSGGGRSLSDFAGGTTLHGVSHVFVPGERSGLTARRTLWALAVIASIALLLLQCVDRVAYYLRYPRITSLDETSNPNVIFPAVTICNFNTLRRSALTYNDLFWTAELLGLPEGVIEAEVAGADLDGQRPSLGASLGLPGVSTADARRPGPGRTFNMLELYARAGHRMEDMLLQCRYRAAECKHVDFVTAPPVDFWNIIRNIAWMPGAVHSPYS